MSNLRCMKLYLVLQLICLHNKLQIVQHSYTIRFFKKYDIEESNPYFTSIEELVHLNLVIYLKSTNTIKYQSLIENLIFVTHIRLDLLYIVSVFSRFMTRPL